MYNIRLATAMDFPRIAPMLKQFYDYSEYDIPYSEDSVQLQFLDTIGGPGEVVIAEHDGEPVGVIGFVVSPFPTNTNYLIGTEILWWVNPEHRGSVVAKELVKTAEQLAKIKYNASHMVMSKLNNSPPLVDVFYRRNGYKAMDTSYMKAL